MLRFCVLFWHEVSVIGMFLDFSNDVYECCVFRYDDILVSQCGSVYNNLESIFQNENDNIKLRIPRLCVLIIVFFYLKMVCGQLTKVFPYHPDRPSSHHEFEFFIQIRQSKQANDSLITPCLIGIIIRVDF